MWPLNVDCAVIIIAWRYAFASSQWWTSRIQRWTWGSSWRMIAVCVSVCGCIIATASIDSATAAVVVGAVLIVVAER